MLRTLKAAARSGLDICTVGAACVRYYLTGKSASTSARLSLMRLHCATNAHASDAVAKVLKAFSGSRPPAAASACWASCQFSASKKSLLPSIATATLCSSSACLSSYVTR